MPGFSFPRGPAGWGSCAPLWLQPGTCSVPKHQEGCPSASAPCRPRAPPRNSGVGKCQALSPARWLLPSRGLGNLLWIYEHISCSSHGGVSCIWLSRVGRGGWEVPVALCQGLQRSLGSQNQGRARRRWRKANCAWHRRPWGPASQRVKAEGRHATSPSSASSLCTSLPARHQRRVAFQGATSTIFLAGLFLTEIVPFSGSHCGSTKSPVTSAGAGWRGGSCLGRDGCCRERASSQPSCAPRSQDHPTLTWSSGSPQKG